MSALSDTDDKYTGWPVIWRPELRPINGGAEAVDVAPSELVGGLEKCRLGLLRLRYIGVGGIRNSACVACLREPIQANAVSTVDRKEL
jgi:hypothetical protein